MLDWGEDKNDGFGEHTPRATDQKKKRKFGLSGQDALDNDASNSLAGKSLSLRPTSSSSSVPSMGKCYDRQVSQGSFSLRNRFNNSDVPEEKVNRSHASLIFSVHFLCAYSNI